MERINVILNFWFRGIEDEAIIRKNDLPFRRWFEKNKFFDQEIREKFETDLMRAKQGACKTWETTARGRLALVILYDQFSRNMYRNTPKMYETDSLALDLALRSIRENRHQQLILVKHIFLYMPLQHAEDIRMQELSLQSFEQLVNDVAEKNPKNVDYYKYHLNYAKRHHAIISRFGRFPHRNAVLGRISTSEELAFLKRSGSSF